MSIMDYTQDDRDRSIRTENEVKHIDVEVKALAVDVKSLVEASRNNAFTISGILESMKEAKTMMHTVGQHNQRIDTLEGRVLECATERREYSRDLDAVEARVTSLEQDKAKMTFLGKFAWAVVTTPALLAAVILGLQFMQTHAK